MAGIDKIVTLWGIVWALAGPVFAGNPILKQGDPGFIYLADPSAEVFDGKVYVYCSHDQGSGGYATMQDYAIVESSDMTNWVNHGVVLEPRTAEGFEYAGGQMNAPDCAYKDGVYYWYFPYYKTYVGVATSTSPTGPWESAIDWPYTDAETAAMTEEELLQAQYDQAMTVIFDPTVFVDDDGQAYIYGTDTKSGMGDGGVQLFGAKLKDNMIELDGDWHQLSSEKVAEAATIFKRNGIYYFMARQGWDETAYWMADNPLPYPGNTNNLETPVYSDPSGYASYQGLITDSADHSVTAPAHMSAIEFEGQWYFFYHRGDVNGGGNTVRSACVDKMEFNPDGTIQRMVYTLDSDLPEPEDPSGLGTMHREAEAFFSQSGVAVEANSDFDDGDEIGLIENGDWAAYTDVDFGDNDGAEMPFFIRASSRTSGGTVELRLDSETGDVIGSISVEGTSSWDRYETFTNTLSGVSGTHDLYLTFSGGSGYLFNLNWFEWTPGSNLVNETSDLVAEWTFNHQTLENIGISGSLHDGILSGTLAFSADTHSGSGYSLDLSSSSFMRVNNSASGDAAYSNTFDSTSFTYSMWVKNTDGNWTQWAEFGGKGNEDADEGWSLRARGFSADSRDGLRGSFYKTSDDDAKDSDPYVDVTDQQWHLLTLTYDGASSLLNLYIDGVLEGSDTSASMNDASSRALVFGAREDGTRGERMLIDNIQFYGRALTGSEVADVFAQELLTEHVEILGGAPDLNGRFQMQFAGMTGAYYRFEYRGKLSGSNDWQVLTNIEALAVSPFEIADPMTNRTRFYRLLLVK